MARYSKFSLLGKARLIQIVLDKYHQNVSSNSKDC